VRQYLRIDCSRLGDLPEFELRHETYQAIRRIAEQDNRKVSDVVRDAIRRYLEAG
jgi:hypothetical protein